MATQAITALCHNCTLSRACLACVVEEAIRRAVVSIARDIVPAVYCSCSVNEATAAAFAVIYTRNQRQQCPDHVDVSYRAYVEYRAVK
jgi:hypothetical protein